jgi:branched-chain amino acid transport system ATP-binding protein
MMLDEPSLGLAPVLVDDLFDMIEALRDRGLTILLVEQNVRRTLTIVDHVFLLATGCLEFSGKPEELMGLADVESAYLGRSDLSL